MTGVKASPDTTIGTAGGVAGSQTVNHYNSTTVINGATTGGTSGGSTGGTGGTTTGTTSGSTGGTTGGETSGGTGSISGGADCDVAPTCDGDPIGCFISQKSWETSCANRIPTVADADAAINAGLGVADNDAPLVPQAGIFNVANFFNPAAAVTECPEDLTIPLGTFGTVTVPVSEWCNFLHIIGLLVLASAALQSSRILLEAVS
ncbi:virulence factor TspB C-terminal domain-related protein [Nevskia ramosa]|uniref:virulence factor TspB C-terminal domain-related protein n=1 Tax=Nevskia ramosa TaxID=64002 RepID=UPI003D116288